MSALNLAVLLLGAGVVSAETFANSTVVATNTNVSTTYTTTYVTTCTHETCTGKATLPAGEVVTNAVTITTTWCPPDTAPVPAPTNAECSEEALTITRWGGEGHGWVTQVDKQTICGGSASGTPVVSYPVATSGEGNPAPAPSQSAGGQADCSEQALTYTRWGGEGHGWVTQVEKQTYCGGSATGTAVVSYPVATGGEGNPAPSQSAGGQAACSEQAFTYTRWGGQGHGWVTQVEKQTYCGGSATGTAVVSYPVATGGEGSTETVTDCPKCSKTGSIGGNPSAPVEEAEPSNSGTQPVAQANGAGSLALQGGVVGAAAIVGLVALF